MAANILAVVKAALGSDSMSQISGLLGENEPSTQQAVDAGLPAILGGLMKQADTSKGAQSVFDMASRSDTSILDSLSNSLSGGNHNALIHNGMGIMSSVFGSTNAGLISSLARLTGIGQGSAGSLLGMLAPLIMGAINKTITQDNLDATGLANMLAAQKDHVAAAIPDELSADIGLRDFVGGGSGAAHASTTAPNSTATATATPIAVANAATSTSTANPTDPISTANNRSPGQISDSVRDADGGLLGKLLPIIILGILAWLGYRYMAGAPVTPPSAPVEKITGGLSNGTALPDGLTDKLTNSLSDATTTVGSITDEASAQSAVEKLQGTTDSINELGLDKLPDAAKGPAKTVIGPLLDSLNGALEKAYAIPGVKTIIEPVVGPMLEKLSALGT